jgi:hypothetical protein
VSLKHKTAGGVLGLIGFLLSPLSWWNDLVVNVPLALAFAWGVSWFWPAAFGASLVVGYWGTNVLGLILLHQGARRMAEAPQPYSRKDLLRDTAVSIAYTLLIVMLAQFKLLEPLPNYFPAK